MRGITLGFIVLFAFVAAAPAAENSVVALSDAPQLFLDDYLLTRMVNVKRVLHQPTKCPQNPLPLGPEHAWEESRMDAGSVLYDDGQKKFRMWYTVLMDKRRYADNFGYACYAESLDGIRWRKPMMKIHDFEGHLPTNIVSKGPAVKDSECLFPSVIRTPHDPSRPYKMLFTHRQAPDNQSHYGLHVASSDDGLHWSEPELVYQGKCDNPPSLVWSETLGEYFGFCRAQDSHPAMAGHIRSTGILTSLDFDRWTPRKKVVITDQRDGYPFTQFHHLMVTQYGDLMIGMADAMHILRHDNKTSTEDVQLICSRDGWNWRRIADRAVFLPNGPQGYDREIVSPRSAFVVKDDTIYIYYQGGRFGQGKANRAREKALPQSARSPRDRGGFCLATLPADRFVELSRTDDAAEGLLRTKPLAFAGRSLVVNAELDEQQGLEVEVLDMMGNVLDGFQADRCRLSKSDALRFHVAWHTADGQAKTLADLQPDKSACLRFRLTGARLYAFQVIDR